MTSATATAPLVLAAVLVWAAAAKLRHPGSALSSMRLLRLPSWLATPGVAAVFPWAEITLAATLVIAPAGVAFSVVAAATVALFVAYWALIARGLRMRPRPGCGCFGRIGSPISATTLARNTVFLLLAAVTAAIAVAGSSTLSLLGDLDTADWWWLVASASTAAVCALVLISERPRTPATSTPDLTTPHLAAPHLAAPHLAAPDLAAPDLAATDDDGLLDYERAPIPHQLLLDHGGAPVTLPELARARAQLLVWITCTCARSHQVLGRWDEWTESMPQIDLRPVTTMALDSTSAAFPHVATQLWLHDHGHVTFRSLGIQGDPAALLLGADGMLAGGPVHGADEVVEFVAEVQAALREA